MCDVWLKLLLIMDQVTQQRIFCFVYFNLLLNAAFTWKLVKILFSLFSNFKKMFSVIFHLETCILQRRVPYNPNIQIDKYENCFWKINLFGEVGLLLKNQIQINKKGWKQPKKSISTSIWVRTAPDSWSKYTKLVW